jgi:hypothetical protein
MAELAHNGVNLRRTDRRHALERVQHCFLGLMAANRATRPDEPRHALYSTTVALRNAARDAIDTLETQAAGQPYDREAWGLLGPLRRVETGAAVVIAEGPGAATFDFGEACAEADDLITRALQEPPRQH